MVRSRSCALAVAIVLLLTGCSSTPSEPTGEATDGALEGVDVSNASEAQTAEITDRVATADEYNSAFQRYRECLSAAGFELADVQFTNSVYEFGVPDAAVTDGADDECYASEFRYTDMLWQSSDPVQNSSDTARLLRECLQEQGLEPKETLAELEEQVREAGLDVSACVS